MTRSSGRIERHHNAIRDMRMDGMTAREIAKKLSVEHGCAFKEKSIAQYGYRNCLPRSQRSNQIPNGRIILSRDLTIRQRAVLTDKARRSGCETISEAALEILRDYLDEEAAKM